jgi:ABC-2 type transport system ATP-binding protein
MAGCEYVTYCGQLSGMSFQRARQRAHEILDLVGMGQERYRSVDTYSTGMKQRVKLAQALVHDPEFVILDEPFSGLDPVNQTELEAFIRNLAGEGKTILFSTHTMQHAERLCDRLVILAKGRKLFDGTLDEARGLFPRRARLGADADLGFVAQLPGVLRAAPPANGLAFWTIDLKEGDDGRALLAACFERGVPLTHFDVAPPGLHDVFVSLVGPAHASLPA